MNSSARRRRRPDSKKPALFTKKEIPTSLLRLAKSKNGADVWALVLPPLLVEVYCQILDELGLRNVAANQMPNDEGPQGGITEEATREHFARSFSGSAARAQLVCLDLTDTFRTTRDALAQLFSGGHVELLDIPCGCGASSALLLCLVAELRQQGVLPKLPLHVGITGWDISAPARKIKRGLFRRLKPLLIHAGIEIKMSKVRVKGWDVTDEEQTSERIADWLKTKSPSAAVGVVAANFSGFLHSKVKDCKSQLREVLRYTGQEDATVLWIEPTTNVATIQLFPNLIKYVLKTPSKLQVYWPDKTRARQAEHAVLHPVQRGGLFQARATALHLEPKTRR